MYTTGRYRIFSDRPGERRLARPRHLVQEGRLLEAGRAYRQAISARPEWRPAWLEYFQLLRSAGQYGPALELAMEAAVRFTGDAVPRVLQGAALVELGRYPEGLEHLEDAAACEPNLALVWHEIGYAAFRLGEHARALLALDRAFALEPHGATLHLRGQVLRDAGQYLAAEVAFDAAAQAAEFPAQRSESEREIATTRRTAAFAAKRPGDLSAGERWFAETGSVVLASAPATEPCNDQELVEAFAQLSRRAGWRFTMQIALDDWEGWSGLSQALEIPVVEATGGLPRGVPLLVARRPPSAGTDGSPVTRMEVGGRGLSFALEQGEDGVLVDVVGRLRPDQGAIDLEAAVRMASHPEGRLAGRSLA
jgi:Tfp pilus assembly protein PilF